MSREALGVAVFFVYDCRYERGVEVVMGDLVSASEAARIARCSADSIRLAARTGRLKAAASTASGSMRLFTREAIQAWVRERKAKREAAKHAA